MKSHGIPWKMTPTSAQKSQLALAVSQEVLGSSFVSPLALQAAGSKEMGRAELVLSHNPISC